MINQSERQSLTLDTLLCIALITLAMALYSALYLHVPVLTEVRDFLIYQGWGSKLIDVFVPTGSDYRPLSWSFFAWQHRAFPYHAEAINLVQFLLLGLGALFAFIHARQLLGVRTVAFLVSVLWLLSLPALHAAFWQATQHDKLAFIFILLALITSLHAIRIDRPRLIPLYSLLVLLLVALAVSTKPVAFVLPGALLAQALLFTREKSGRGYLRSLALIAAPVAYGVIHAVGYLFKMNEAWRAHATSGDAAANVLVYIRSVANIDYDGSLALAWLLFAPVALIWIGAIGRWGNQALKDMSAGKPNSRSGSEPDAVLVYLCAIFIGSIFVLARARHPAAFYVLLPTYVFLASIAAAAISAALNRQVWIRRSVITVVSGMTIGLLVTSYSNFTGSGRLGQWRQASVNLADGYEVIRRRVDPDAVNSILFAFQRKPEGYFYFFSGGDHTDIDPAVPPFVFRRSMKKPITNSFDEFPTRTAGGGELVVTWSSELKLIEAKLAESSLYHDPAAPAGSEAYVPGTTIGFRSGGDGSRNLVKGWSREEPHGTWSDGDLATLVVNLGRTHEAPLDLVVSGQLFVSENHPLQKIRVVANGQIIGHWAHHHGAERGELRATIPAEIAAQETLNLEFHILSPRSPANLGLGQDDRELGILLQELRIESRQGIMDGP